MSTFRVTALLCALSLAGCGKPSQQLVSAEQIAQEHLAFVQATLGRDPRELPAPAIPTELVSAGPTSRYWADVLATHERLKASWTFDLAIPSSTSQGLHAAAQGVKPIGDSCTPWQETCEPEGDGTRCVRKTTCGGLTTTVTSADSAVATSFEVMLDGTAADGTVHREFVYSSTQFLGIIQPGLSSTTTIAEGEQRPSKPGPWWHHELTTQMADATTLSTSTTRHYAVDPASDEIIEKHRAVTMDEFEGDRAYTTWIYSEKLHDVFVWIVEEFPRFGICTRMEFDEAGDLLHQSSCF